MKKIIGLSLMSALVISIVLFACSKSSSPAMSTNNPNTVSIKNMAFSPNALNVTAGTTVTWVNNDGTTHTVTADDGSFDSGDIAPGGSFTHKFAAVGTVSYHCNIHPMMTGSVAVK
jgi:plastocyanin